MFSELRSGIDLAALEAIMQGEIDTWFICPVPNDPNQSYPTVALLEVTSNEWERLKQPNEKQANIQKGKRESEEKAAQRGESSQINHQKKADYQCAKFARI